MSEFDGLQKWVEMGNENKKLRHELASHCRHCRKERVAIYGKENTDLCCANSCATQELIHLQEVE